MSLPRRALAMGAFTALALAAGLATPALAARAPGTQPGYGGCPPGVDPRTAFCLPSTDHARTMPTPLYQGRGGCAPGADPRLMILCSSPGDHTRAGPDDGSRRHRGPREPDGVRPPFDGWGSANPNPGPFPPRWRPY